MSTISYNCTTAIQGDGPTVTSIIHITTICSANRRTIFRNSQYIGVLPNRDFCGSFTHIYDHSFPLRSKAPKEYETRYL